MGGAEGFFLPLTAGADVGAVATTGVAEDETLAAAVEEVGFECSVSPFCVALAGTVVVEAAAGTACSGGGWLGASRP